MRIAILLLAIVLGGCSLTPKATIKGETDYADKWKVSAEITFSK
jgi:PBP1b-binding outer membrane lipoprotein LpoB